MESLSKESKRDAKQKNKDESSGQSEGEEEADLTSIEPAAKRVNMPKKSKHRMHAHINPMGNLTIPV